MPFTPSHAVVALAFVRTPLVPAAIAIGAMTPDLPLFVRVLGLRYSVTHDLRWLPLNVLLALALLLVWRCALRPAVRELSPRWLAARLPVGWDAGALRGVKQTFPSLRGVALLLLSLGIGVASHVVWDLFTHEGRWGAEVLPVLGRQWGIAPGYTWLQHTSGATGLAVVGVWAAVRLRRRPARTAARMLPASVRWGWWVSLPLALALAWAVGLSRLGPFTADFTAAHLAYRMLPPACAIWSLGSLALCVTVQAVRRAVSGVDPP